MCIPGERGMRFVPQKTRCSVCRELLPLSEFYIGLNGGHINCPGPPKPEPKETPLMRSTQRDMLP